MHRLNTEARTAGLVLGALLVQVGWLPSPSGAQDGCFPPCRRGFTCFEDTCIPECSPPCSANATCTPDGCRGEAAAALAAADGDPLGSAAPAAAPAGEEASPTASGAEAVPVCAGNDPAAAREASRLGKDLYRRAVAAGPDLGLMQAALEQFDRQCAAGDDWSLELRASALLVLGRHVEAAQNIDAFLRAHPIPTLPADVRLRVEGNLPLFFEQVGSVRISSDAADTLVSVNGRQPIPADGRVIRVAAGRVNIEARAPAAEPHFQELQAPPGEVVDVRLRMAGAPSAASHAQDDELPPRGPRASQDPERSGGGALTTLGVTATVVGGVLLAGGVVAALVAVDRANTYNADCAESPELMGCSAVEAEHETASTLRNIGFVGGGVVLGTGIVMMLLDSGDEESAEETVARCGPFGAEPGIACRFRF